MIFSAIKDSLSTVPVYLLESVSQAGGEKRQHFKHCHSRSKGFIHKTSYSRRHSARVFESERSGPPEAFAHPTASWIASATAECREKRKERLERRQSPQVDRATRALTGQEETNCLPNSHTLRQMPTPSAPLKNIPETQSSHKYQESPMYLHSEEMLDSEDASQGVYSMRQRGSMEQKRCTPAGEQDGSKSGCRHGPLAINWGPR